MLEILIHYLIFPLLIGLLFYIPIGQIAEAVSLIRQKQVVYKISCLIHFGMAIGAIFFVGVLVEHCLQIVQSAFAINSIHGIAVLGLCCICFNHIFLPLYFSIVRKRS